jgi:hypothetical protein
MYPPDFDEHVAALHSPPVGAPVEETCPWCAGTGTYSGPMMGRQYVGPCMVCDIDSQTGPSEAL